ncbi:restriction endonuclease [Paenibacillus tepidiphilus]|uniref:restriction endonuclease n=1 Tax=Paenibacillus tepidiphilus TaxID=2608683 RepID=UPI00123B1B95|nr:restriction endonuclease [Paenibacillus tepidiphilus]
MSKWWMVRAGDNNELIPKWESKNVVSIGWNQLGDPKSYTSRDAMIQKAHKVYHESKPGSRIQWASQVWKFSRDIKIGDRIVTYTKDTREYLVGTVTKSHDYNESVISDYYPNVISVKWEDKRVSRDLLSQGAKNSLGGISTVFRIDDWGMEFNNLLLGNTSTSHDITDDGQDAETNNAEEFIQQAKTLMEDAIDKLDPWQMQDLVGGLLSAMGYQVKVSPKGPDGGVDILAHRDAFGFEKPIIKVQVKHRNSASNGAEIQQLLGTTPMDASSIFVSTGGYTSSARTVAQQNGVKLLDLSELVQLICEWYEKLPIISQQLIPLQKIYVPLKV